MAYILEAHADDAWRMGQPHAIANHTTLEERKAACAFMCREVGMSVPCVLDKVTTGCGNPAHGARCGKPNLERLYGGWPLRFMVFCPLTGTLVHKGMPQGDSFDFDDIDRAIVRWIDERGTDAQKTLVAERRTQLFGGVAAATDADDDLANG